MINTESVTVIRDFGIQLCSKYYTGVEVKRVCYDLFQRIRIVLLISFYKKYYHSWWQFLDHDKVARVFIHEFIEGSSVHYCLAFLVPGEPKLLLSYRYVYPGLSNVQRVFQLCAEEIISHDRAMLTRTGFKWILYELFKRHRHTTILGNRAPFLRTSLLGIPDVPVWSCTVGRVATKSTTNWP